MKSKITEHNIEKMLESYGQCDKELEAIMKILDVQYDGASLGYVHNCWMKRQRRNVLRQFQNLQARRNKLRSDIHLYYMEEIERKSVEKCRAISSSEFIESEKKKYPKSLAWTNSGEASTLYKRAAFNGKKMPKFSRILRVMKMRFGGKN